MTIINRDDCPPFTTADGSTIRELLNPANCGLKNGSLAEATLAPQQSTTRHHHPLAEEIYLIVGGTGKMEIEGEERTVRVGDAIAVPNGHKHQITNCGEDDLRFWCFCAPAYSHADTILDDDSTNG